MVQIVQKTMVLKAIPGTKRSGAWAYCKENGIIYQSFWTLTGSPALLTHSHTTLLPIS
ncbi:hypothetical protein DFH29DRAFT_581259 [Suillus ampliporus]|nr:hypothetical protein DFH29DRAFT_581259 [Suillus ampliporus]